MKLDKFYRLYIKSKYIYIYIYYVFIYICIYAYVITRVIRHKTLFSRLYEYIYIYIYIFVIIFQKLFDPIYSCKNLFQKFPWNRQQPKLVRKTVFLLAPAYIYIYVYIYIYMYIYIYVYIYIYIVYTYNIYCILSFKRPGCLYILERGIYWRRALNREGRLFKKLDILSNSLLSLGVIQ